MQEKEEETRPTYKKRGRKAGYIDARRVQAAIKHYTEAKSHLEEMLDAFKAQVLEGNTGLVEQLAAKVEDTDDDSEP